MLTGGHLQKKISYGQELESGGNTSIFRIHTILLSHHLQIANLVELLFLQSIILPIVSLKKDMTVHASEDGLGPNLEVKMGMFSR
jgi:hypothetical protein